jgi:L-galactose dehydrogenase
MPDMFYKTLGRTGLHVSVVGYGASPLGNEFGATDPAEGQRAVHAAISLGINYFDVSPYYGRTLAETRLGAALVGHRQEVILATKCGRYGSTLPDGFDFSAGRIVRSVEESLARLRTDWIDVFQLHDIEFTHREQILGEALEAMQRLKRAGKVRFIGITGYPVGLLQDVAARAELDTVLSYCRYDLLDTSLDDVLAPLAREKGFGLINASPLHMRLLTERGAPDWHPAPKVVVVAAQQAAALCRERGVDIADLAMQFALDYASVTTTLVGMSKVAHVERNVALVGAPPDPALLAEVRALLAPVANVAWRTGLPENDDPGAVGGAER